MTPEDKKKNEQQVKTTESNSKSDQGRENIKPLKEETLEERAKRENWTDVAESHLGIDE
jgi:hypothetical protein